MANIRELYVNQYCTYSGWHGTRRTLTKGGCHVQRAETMRATVCRIKELHFPRTKEY